MINILRITLLAAALSACYSERRVEPIELQPAATSSSTSSVEVNDVKVTIDAHYWVTHHGRIAEDVIPVRIAIRNESDRPMVFRYRDVALIDETGRELAAMPPYAFDADDRVAVIERPRFEHRDYELIPRYRRYYGEDVVIYGRSMDDDDSDYYVTSYHRWRHAPTADMLAYALPEGVLKPGGSASGYLYFDASGLRPGDNVTLDAQLYAPDDSGRLTPLAKVTLPFEAS